MKGGKLLWWSLKSVLSICFKTSFPNLGKWFHCQFFSSGIAELWNSVCLFAWTMVDAVIQCLVTCATSLLEKIKLLSFLRKLPNTVLPGESRVIFLHLFLSLQTPTSSTLFQISEELILGRVVESCSRPCSSCFNMSGEWNEARSLLSQQNGDGAVWMGQGRWSYQNMRDSCLEDHLKLDTM